MPGVNGLGSALFPCIRVFDCSTMVCPHKLFMVQKQGYDLGKPAEAGVLFLRSFR